MKPATHKKSALFLSALFLLTIFSPLVIMKLSEPKEVSHLEKRKLAPKPELALAVKSPQEFTAALESYFSDHFGLREEFVQFYNAFYIYLLGISTSENVLIGKDHWLYFTYDALKDFAGQKPLSQSTLVHRKTILEERQQWLAEHGIHYLFLPVPNKLEIYPEYLPNRIQRLRKQTNYEQLMEHLAKPPAFTGVLDLRPVMLEGKKDHLIYNTTDTHWNSAGAVDAYQAIIEHVRHRWFPSMNPPLTKEQFTPVKEKLSGNLTNYINAAHLFQEDVIIYHDKKFGNTISFKQWDNYVQPHAKEKHLRKGYFFAAENPEATGKAIFISDSFGGWMKEYFPEHFAKTIFVRDARFEDVTDLILQEKPDIVFDMKVDRDFWVSFGETPEIRDTMVQKQIARSTSLFSLENADITAITPYNGRFGHKIANKFVFNAHNNDPQWVLKLNTEKDSELVVIHCEITSPTATTMQVFYLTPESTQYQEQNSVSAQLREGENSVYLRLFGPINLDLLRIDPGSSPGVYELHNLTIAKK